MLSDVFRTADHALELLLHRAASVNPWLCALGIVTYILAQAVRPRGWHTIIKAAYPDARELRPRHTMAAYLAGAGLNGVIPARGGDIVKLWLLHRRIPGARYPTLAATFVPETLFETLFGIGLVIWALSRGFLPVPTSSGELPTSTSRWSSSTRSWRGAARCCSLAPPSCSTACCAAGSPTSPHGCARAS